MARRRLAAPPGSEPGFGFGRGGCSNALKCKGFFHRAATKEGIALVAMVPEWMESPVSEILL